MPAPDNDESEDPSDEAEPSKFQRESVEPFVEALDAERLPQDLQTAWETLGDGPGGPLRGTGQAVKSISSAVTRAGQGLQDVGEGLGEDIAAAAREDLGVLGEVALGALGEGAEFTMEFTGEISGSIVEASGKVGEGVGGAIDNVGKGVNQIVDGDVGEGFESIYDGGADLVGGVFSGVADLGGGAVGAVGEVVEGGVEVGGAIVGPLVGAGVDLAREAAGGFKDLVVSAFDRPTPAEFHAARSKPETDSDRDARVLREQKEQEDYDREVAEEIRIAEIEQWRQDPISLPSEEVMQQQDAADAERARLDPAVQELETSTDGFATYPAPLVGEDQFSDAGTPPFGDPEMAGSTDMSLENALYPVSSISGADSAEAREHETSGIDTEMQPGSELASNDLSDQGASQSSDDPDASSEIGEATEIASDDRGASGDDFSSPLADTTDSGDGSSGSRDDAVRHDPSAEARDSSVEVDGGKSLDEPGIDGFEANGESYEGSEYEAEESPYAEEANVDEFGAAPFDASGDGLTDSSELTSGQYEPMDEGRMYDEPGAVATDSSGDGWADTGAQTDGDLDADEPGAHGLDETGGQGPDSDEPAPPGDGGTDGDVAEPDDDVGDNHAASAASE